ncbi:hypothetical protein [Helicobacter sp. MIT 05-5294]|nr:hypothetical protein [Helicobacter sp. MIT 05-5294]
MRQSLANSRNDAVGEFLKPNIMDCHKNPHLQQQETTQNTP